MFRKLVRLVAIAALGCIFSVSISTAIFFVTRAVRPVFDFLVQYYPYVIALFLIVYAIIYLRVRRNKAIERERRLRWVKERQSITARKDDSVRFCLRFEKEDEFEVDFAARASRVSKERNVWREISQVFLEAMLLLVLCIAVVTPIISIALYIFFGVPAKIATVSSTISCFIISLSATFLCNNWFNSVGEKASFVIAATCLSPAIIPLFPQLNYFSLW